MSADDVNRLALGMRWGRVLAAIDGALAALRECDPSVLPAALRVDLGAQVEGLRGVSQRAWQAFDDETKPARPRSRR